MFETEVNMSTVCITSLRITFILIQKKNIKWRQVQYVQVQVHVAYSKSKKVYTKARRQTDVTDDVAVPSSPTAY